ncbi:MAG: LPXTG cell wall anchor domain-containing protein [Ruminiclostridium sp.]|nr:LPXTG cell wall anchor domain-containing protein [Ruminiclostridium sp.]
MKLNKIVSGIAVAAVAASALAVSSGAQLVVSSATNPGFSSTGGMWMQQIYVPGQGIDFGIDPREMGKVVFTITPDSPDDFEGGTGGSVVISSGPQNGAPADHNWPGKNYWGVLDEDKEIFGRDPENDTNPIHTEIAGDYIYTLTVDVDDTCNVQQESYDAEDCYVQIAFQEWGNEIFTDIKVLELDIYDKSGALMCSFDGDGNFTAGTVSAPAAAPAAVEETAAPAAAEETAAPAPAAGDVAAATDSTKGSPNTGIEDVAVAAGLAIVAGGAIVAAKKRK